MRYNRLVVLLVVLPVAWTVLLTACGDADHDSREAVDTSTTALSTASTVPVQDAERAFVMEMLPAVFDFYALLEGPGSAAQIHYALEELSGEWAARKAPSARTQSALSDWLDILHTWTQCYRLLADEDKAGVAAMQEELDRVNAMSGDLGADMATLVGDLELMEWAANLATPVQMPNTTSTGTSHTGD